MLDLHPGTLVRTATSVLEILGLRIHKGRVRYQVLDGDDAMELSLGEILARATPPQATGSLPPPSDDAWLDWLKPDERQLVERGIEDLHDILYPIPYDPDAVSPDGSDPNRYADHVDEPERIRRKIEDSAGRKAGEGKVWKRATIYRHLAAYPSERGRCFLHGNRRLDIDVVAQTDPEIFKVVRDYYQRALRGPKRQQQVHYVNVLDALRETGLAQPFEPLVTLEVAKAEPDEVLPLARFAALWRVLDKGAPGGRSGKLRASQSKRPDDTKTKHTASEFGDILELDATPCNFEVRGENGKFKPHAVFAVDVATRYVWLRLTPGPPTSLDYRLLLFGIICGFEWMPTDPDLEVIPVRPRYLRVLPGTIVMDHGREGENEQILGLLAALHIDVLWARTRRPTDKPRIESMIRTYASAEQLLDAYKGNSTANSGEATAAHLPTFEAAHLIFKGFSSWYADQPHNGLRHGLVFRQLLTPNQAVGASLVRDGHRLANDPNVVFSFLPVLRETPAADGVAVTGVRYAPQDRYKEIWFQSYKQGKGRRSLPFHYDPSDGRWLFYNLPGTYEWIVLFRPGGDDEAVTPFDDVRHEVLSSIMGHRRPSKKERIAAIDALKQQVVDPVMAVDANRAPTPTRPHVMVSGRASVPDSPTDWLQRQTGVDVNALDIFDINADDYGYDDQEVG